MICLVDTSDTAYKNNKNPFFSFNIVSLCLKNIDLRIKKLIIFTSQASSK